MVEAKQIELPDCEVLREYPIPDDEWHQLRKQGIGGSDAAIIMGANPYETQLSLAMQKTGRMQPFDGNEAAEVGTILEPLIRNHLVEQYLVEQGYAVDAMPIEPWAMFRSKEYPYMTANIDGLISMRVEDDDGSNVIATYNRFTAGLEIKTGKVYQLKHWANDRVPDSYWWQVQHYMAVTGLRMWLVFGLIGNTRLVRFVERDDVAIDELAWREGEFWDIVRRNDPLWFPMPTGHERDMDALMELGSPQVDDTADLTDAEQAVRRYIDLGEQIKDLKEEREQAKQQVLHHMGNAKYGRAGSLQVTFSRYTTSRLDSKRLKKERPEVAAEYTNETETGRLSVKESDQ